MLQALRNKMAVAFLAVCMTVFSAVAAFAGISATDMTTITDGITASTADYYKVGGVILAVIAGIWAFLKLKGLLAGR